MSAFEALGLNEQLLQAITDLGFETPTPIQEQAIPVLLSGTTDFVGLGANRHWQNSSFWFPFAPFNKQSRTPSASALIVCPTRELCLQITNDLSEFCKTQQGYF